ncbi:alanyl-tRNA editing protein [Oceanobacillus polygoni]|uniref:Alanyl-tRNA synthetase n=1 Tax=Oceanobacillus polygoni TaxID=1235259 RepID=A0A9X0YWQ1_9BACI|nr:alanine--tRNA ligase-related protein [Oceanobacillus polygoni]MBP2079942.1 alanyl-tRNA synthetase [Oceanobacillus polygoni]
MPSKLYYKSPYTAIWNTNINQTIERNGDLYIILEETAFYPQGGGQPSDLGSINGVPVLDVFTEENDILHKVEQLPDKIQEVTCTLDWQRRFDHMQQHSGQHLLSAIFRELLQANTISFHLGTDDVTIDVDQSTITKEQLQAVESEVNKQISHNRPIQSYFVTNEQIKEIPLVKLPKVTENIRIVEIEGIEYNACGGTHVSRTGEIGMVKLFHTEKLKGGTRIHFKCGYRALEEFKETLLITDTLSKKFNTGKKDILDRFEKWEQEHRQMQSQLTVLKEQHDIYLTKELLSNVEGTVLTHIFSSKPFKEIQKLAAKIATEHQLTVLFATTTENKVILAHNGSDTFSCGVFFKEHLKAFNGKGGGSAQSAQAGFASSEEALQFYHFASKEIC